MTTRAWKPWLGEKEREKFREAEEQTAERLAAMGMPDVPPHHFDKEGNPISLADWCEAFEDFDYRQVADDQVGDLRISTVWMGLDMGYSGVPLIFETMVFDNSPEGLAETQETLDKAWGGVAVLGPERFSNRYPDEASARKGHHEAVVATEAGLVK